MENRETDWNVPSRYGALGLFLRRVLRRVLRPVLVRQAATDSWLSSDVEALSARVQELESQLEGTAGAPGANETAWDLGRLSCRLDAVSRSAGQALDLALPRMLSYAVGPHSGGRKLVAQAWKEGELRKVICSAAVGPFVELLALSLATLEPYARRHRWELIISTEDHAPGRPPSWGKIPLVRELLDGYDLVLWIDADAMVVDLSADITDELEDGKDLYMIEHRADDPPHETPNAGVFVLRAGPWAEELLDRVWNSDHLIDHPWWENAALLEVLGYELEPVARLTAPTELMSRVKLIDSAWNSVPHGTSRAAKPNINHWGRAVPFEVRRDGMLSDLRALWDSVREGSQRLPSDFPSPRTRKEFPLLLNSRRLLGTAAEIGVAGGDFSSHLLHNWHGACLISVDPWLAADVGEYVDVSNLSQPQQEALYQKTCARLAPFGPRSEIWRMTSEEAAEQVPDGSLDFVYIDARHDEDAVSQDLSLWLAKVRPGGIIAGHDYLDGTLPEGVFGAKTAVERFVGERGLRVKATPDDAPLSSWWVEVP